MLSKFSVKKPFTILVAVIIIIVFGVLSFSKMTPELMPNINMPYVMVMTTYTGASPEEVEADVTRPLEKQMATLDHIKTLNSQSNENYSMVILEFADTVNMDSISVDIREKIDLIKGNWNEKVGTPIVLKLNPDMMPVTVAAVSMKGKSTVDTSTFVEENLLSPLEGIEGVASVNATGLVTEDIQIVLSQKKIDAINEKTSDAITGKFAGGKNQLNNGINSALGGQNQINSGKDKIKDAQNKTAVQIEAARTQLQRSKEQLVNMRTAVVQYYAAKAENALIKQQIKAQNPGETDAQIEARCMQDRTYMRNAAIIRGAEEAAKQAGLQSVPTLEELNKQIAAIDKALAELNIQQQQANAMLGNNMAELSAGGAALQATVMQLQSSLAQIQGTEEAAINSANLTGILTMDNISAILEAQNFSMPAGYVSDGQSDILVSVGDKIESISEMKKLVLLDMGVEGVKPVTLSDVADIANANNAAETYAKINGDNGVLLTFSKQSGYATADVADRVAEKFDELSAANKGLTFTMLSDQGEYIHMVIDSVLQNLLMGAILAIIILLFFLRDIRPTIITAVSIPISVTFAVLLMYFSGVTLNVISLAGLAVGVGMLVDNSIVVIENIYRLRALGYSNTKAAISGAVQVSGAITASTLTTVCVFVPILFVEGMTKQLFMDMALTIAYSLLASLFIALTLVPAMARGMLRDSTKKTTLSPESNIILKYKSLVEYCLDHRKRILIGAIVLLLLSSGLALARGFSYMPSMAQPQMSVNVQMPDGSDLKTTAETTDEIAARIEKLDYVDTVGAMLASDANSSMGFSMGGEKDTTQSMLYVILNEDKLDQGKDLAKAIEAMSEEFKCEITASEGQDMMQMMGGSGVQLNVYSDDLDDLRNSAIDIEKKLSKIKGIQEVSDTTEDSKPELKISVNKNKAMSYGLTVAQVFADISSQLSKDKAATTLVRSGESTDVVLANEKAKSLTKKDLSTLIITGKKADGSEAKVRLSRIASITEDKTLNAISHEAQKRTRSISGELKEGYNITRVTSEAQKVVDEMTLPASVSVEFSGENETIMDAMEQLLLLIVLGILMVYLVMVAQFQSLRSPLIVMFTVPLAFTGGMIGLLVTGQDVSVVSLIGFVMLVGVIVNNAIVLVDCINQFREGGMERHEAIVEAGAVRMRPVLMTAITTVLGLLPLAIGMGSGAEMMQPVAIVCIGGLVYATLMTLIVIPIMYSYMSRKHMDVISEEDLEVTDA